MGDACTHCGALVADAPDAADDDARFCCAGCRAAHSLIVGAGLGDYYRLAPAPGVTPGRISSESWDDLVRPRADGASEITWHVGGMHCAACIWILERLPALHAGVSSSL